MIEALTDRKILEAVCGGSICIYGFDDAREDVSIQTAKTVLQGTTKSIKEKCKSLCCESPAIQNPGISKWYSINEQLCYCHEILLPKHVIVYVIFDKIIFYL